MLQFAHTHIADSAQTTPFSPHTPPAGREWKKLRITGRPISFVRRLLEFLLIGHSGVHIDGFSELLDPASQLAA